MRQPLTARQREALDFITYCLDERGYPPTLREIGEHMGIRSTNGVNDHLKALERKGYLVRDDLKSRALRPRGLKTDNANMVSVPLVGDVAAGDPILAIEQAEDSVQIDRFFIGSGEGVFALRIKGESMINDGIYDGDFIFVRKQLTANRGDIVVAMIEGEATVKRYYPEGDRIRFQPANDNMDPIYVHRSEFRSVDLLGIVVGVYRKM